MTKKKITFFVLSTALLVSLLSAAMVAQMAPRDSLYRYLSMFTEVFALARSSYVEEVAPAQLMDGAFVGVTDAIDEFSYYVPPARLSGYTGAGEDVEERLGLNMTRRFGYGYVIATVKGSPADAGGIKAGDLVESIDGQTTGKMAIWEMRQALVKEDGAPVRLTILTTGMSKRSEVSIQPRPFPAPLPRLEMIEGIAYVRIPFFGKGTAEAFGQLLDRLEADGSAKLIVDVRGNAGGAIPEAIASADLLLESGRITSLTGQRVDNRDWNADPSIRYRGEIQLLADSSTAGPAEVFIAAIQENRRGELVGRSTYGKAIDQRFVELPSGGGLNLTVGHYRSPEGKVIKTQGIRPDVMVDLTALLLERGDDDSAPDLILNRALSRFGVERTIRREAA
jgi:carboxyl-terminal processing protease